MSEQRKPVTFIGSARAALKAFPPLARNEAGHQLDLVQKGENPKDWKPMTSIGPGAREIRVHLEGEHRVIYVARFMEAVYVLHAFEKRTRKTASKEIELARRRYAQVLALRGRQAG